MNIQTHLSRKKLSQISLSKEGKSLILGSLLGDGCLKIYKGYKNAKFSIRHTNDQKNYLLWKVEKLRETHVLGTVSKGKPDGVSNQIKWIFQSNVSSQLTEIHEITHKKNQKRVKRKWLNHLTPLGLAIWWFDDGSLICHRRRGVFCTDNFTEKECVLLKNYLSKVWKIRVTIHPIHRKATGKKYFRIWICNSELQKFLNLIVLYVPLIWELFEKKMIINYKNPVLQQRWISQLVDILKNREIKGFETKNFFEKLRERYSPGN